MHSRLCLIVIYLGFALCAFGLPRDKKGKPNCRCFPGDACWPSQTDWNVFNRSVDGRLVATSPLAAPCHDDGFAPYDEERCNYLKDVWTTDAEVHYTSSSSVMQPYFANQSCDPFLPRSSQCVIGSYVQFAVNVSETRHISKTIRFANQHNIRLVIRNTGHDYNGKSTGAGALGVWLHHLKDIDIIDYKSPDYKGKAIKMGAGVQGFEAYAAAHEKGLAVVGGECPTVGIAGGYTQGGGHSALASKYGLGADQTLEWEVVDGTGRRMRATPHLNSDLYWAMSGGGGGTYAIAISLTAKAHQDMPVSGANLTFTSDGVSQDTFYDAVSAYHATLPTLVDEGAMSVWYFTNQSFSISPLTAPGVSGQRLGELLKPFLDTLDNFGIKYQHVIRDFPSYVDEYYGMQLPIPVGTVQYGGRLIPRSVVQNNNSELTAAYRYINEQGAQFIGVGINVSQKVAGNVDNAVLPAWRDALIDTVIATPYNFTAPLSDMEADQNKITYDLIPKLAELTPDGGCYLAEGDFRQPDWKQVFYGPNYDKLASIKKKYDPNDMFYALTAVGSDAWLPDQDGRLCKT